MVGTKKKIGLGIIGCGVIGRHHLTAASTDPGIELVAVADLDETLVSQAAEKFAVPRVYNDGASLIDDPEIDAVVLAVITGVRAPLAYRALRKGKHVLLEKPPALNAGQIRRYMKLQGDRVVACCSSRLSFLDGAVAARRVVENGNLGEIRIVRCRGIRAVAARNDGWQPPSWRVSHRLNGGGYLVNWGVYDFDYLMHVTGWKLEPEWVLAQTWPVAPALANGRVAPGSDAETHAAIFIRCSNGAVITLERGEAVAMEGENIWQITGDRGSLRLRMVPGGDGPVVTLDTAHPETGLSTEVILADPGADIQHQMPVRDFAAAIRERRSPHTDLRKALTIQKILDAAYRSSRIGRAVRVRKD
jgi:predicted dehydrogenase